MKKLIICIITILMFTATAFAEDTEEPSQSERTDADTQTPEEESGDVILEESDVIIIDGSSEGTNGENTEGVGDGSPVEATENTSEEGTSEPINEADPTESTEESVETAIGELKYEVTYNSEHTFATVVITYDEECEEMTLANQDVIQLLTEKGIYEINYDLSDWVNTMAYNVYSNGLVSFDVNVWGENWETPLLNKRVELVITDIAGENKYTVAQNEVATFAETKSSASMSVSYTNVSSYTWSIPADLSLNTADTLAVSASNSDLEADTTLKIKVSSANNFIMKGSNRETMDAVSYTITDENGTVLSNAGNNIVLEYTSSDAGTKTNNLKFATSSKPIYNDTYSDTLTFTAQIGLAIGAKITVGTKKYTILDQYDNGQYLVMERDSIGNIQYNPNVDENNANLYEGSYIDNYLNTTYFNTLSNEIQNAIVDTTIKQNFYSLSGMGNNWTYSTKTDASGEYTGWWYNEGTSESPNWVRYYNHTPVAGNEGAYPLRCWTLQSKGYNGVESNEIPRKIFLPSLEEVSKVVNLSDELEVYNFLKNTNGSQSHLWLRDSRSEYATQALILYYSNRSLDHYNVTDTYIGVRPAYVLDLSQLTFVMQ